MRVMTGPCASVACPWVWSHRIQGTGRGSGNAAAQAAVLDRRDRVDELHGGDDARRSPEDLEECSVWAPEDSSRSCVKWAELAALCRFIADFVSVYVGPCMRTGDTWADQQIPSKYWSTATEYGTALAGPLGNSASLGY